MLEKIRQSDKNSFCGWRDRIQILPVPAPQTEEKNKYEHLQLSSTSDEPELTMWIRSLDILAQKQAQDR